MIRLSELLAFEYFMNTSIGEAVFWLKNLKPDDLKVKERYKTPHPRQICEPVTPKLLPYNIKRR
jgi:hypothetical protein